MLPIALGVAGSPLAPILTKKPSQRATEWGLKAPFSNKLAIITTTISVPSSWEVWH